MNSMGNCATCCSNDNAAEKKVKQIFMDSLKSRPQAKLALSQSITASSTDYEQVSCTYLDDKTMELLSPLDHAGLPSIETDEGMQDLDFVLPNVSQSATTESIATDNKNQPLHKIVQYIPAPNGKKENEFTSNVDALLFWNQLKNIPKNTKIARIWYKSNNTITPRLWTIVDLYGVRYLNQETKNNDDDTKIMDTNNDQQKRDTNNDDAVKINQISEKDDIDEKSKSNIEPAKETLIFHRRENGQTFEGMNNIIAKYYQYMQDKTYFEQDSRGKFLAFCQDKNLKQNNFWCQLFEVPIEKCIYLKFDKQFPLFYRKNKKSMPRYSSDIDGIDKAFGDYYIALDYGDEYFDENGDGKFKVYCEECDLDFDTLIT